MFSAPSLSQESPWYYTRCEPLSEEESTQSAGKDKRHAFRKDWCNITGKLIYRFKDVFYEGLGVYTYQTLSKLAWQLTMYAHSDYKYPMHDGRVLDVEKNRIIYRRRKTKENNLPKPKVKGAK